MTNVLAATPTPTAATATSTRSIGVTITRVVRSEWLKFRSVRSNVVGMAAAVTAAVGLGTLFSSLAGDGSAGGPAGARAATDSLSSSLGGFQLAQLVVGIFGVLFVTSEYSSGLIRTTFTAVGNRLPVLWAKITVYSATTLLTMTASAFAVFFLGQAVYGGSGEPLTLATDGVLRALVGQGLYLTCVAAVGVTLGFILRSTASAIGVLFTTLMLAPVLVGLLPDSISEPVGKVLPSKAGAAITSLTRAADALTPTSAAITLTTWVAGLVGFAALLITRRDA